MAGRQGPAPGVDVRHGVGARPAAGLRRPAGPHGAGHVGRAAAALAGPAGAREPVGADVGRRPRLRHRQPRPPDRPAEARLDAPAARPRLAVHERPARPHAAAVAVRRRRGPARRQGGAGAEDAPHDHRRRGRRADVAAVPRLRARRPAPTAVRPRRRRRDAAAPAAVGRRDDPRHAGRRLPPAHRDHQAGPHAARRPDGDPGRRRRHGGHHPRRPPAALRRRPGPLAAVDRPFAAPPLRGRAGAVPGDEGRRQAPRRHAEHGVHRPPPPTPPGATTPTSARRSSTCARRWPSAPARRRRTPTRSRSPG